MRTRAAERGSGDSLNVSVECGCNPEVHRSERRRRLAMQMAGWAVDAG